MFSLSNGWQTMENSYTLHSNIESPQAVLFLLFSCKYYVFRSESYPRIYCFSKICAFAAQTFVCASEKSGDLYKHVILAKTKRNFVVVRGGTSGIPSEHSSGKIMAMFAYCQAQTPTSCSHIYFSTMFSQKNIDTDTHKRKLETELANTKEGRAVLRVHSGVERYLFCEKLV